MTLPSQARQNAQAQQLAIRNQLTDAQRAAVNFGLHTINGIIKLMDATQNGYGEAFSLDDAYNLVAGGTASQVEGIVLGLSRANVASPNFGYHTIRGLEILRQNEGLSLNTAFAQVAGRTPAEVSARVGIQFVQTTPLFGGQAHQAAGI